MRNLASTAPIFAALGDPTRLHIVELLCSTGPQSITQLTDGTRVTRQAVTKHLHALADAGLARSSRQGREQIWHIEPTPLTAARRTLDAISARWDAAIDRLRAFVEEDEE